MDVSRDQTNYSVQVQNPFEQLDQFEDLDAEEVLQRLESQTIQAKKPGKTEHKRPLDVFPTVKALSALPKLKSGQRSTNPNTPLVPAIKTEKKKENPGNPIEKAGLPPRFTNKGFGGVKEQDFVPAEQAGKIWKECNKKGAALVQFHDPQAKDTQEKDSEVIAEHEADVEESVVPEAVKAKEMTLDEYKAILKRREKPKFNERKAGEGEKGKKEKLVPLIRTNNPTDIKEQEDEEYHVLYKQSKKQVVKLDWRFPDRRASRPRPRPRPETTKGETRFCFNDANGEEFPVLGNK